MCDYSLQNVRSRPAKVADKLVTRDFGTGTRGFASTDDLGVAVCLLPGIRWRRRLPARRSAWLESETVNHQTAIFRQVNKEMLTTHHDASNFQTGAPYC